MDVPLHGWPLYDPVQLLHFDDGHLQNPLLE
jgi:hypothetical protein